MAETVPDPAAAPASPERDAEVNSARQVFRDLDKAWRATRTYGISNAVTRRFYEQLQELMFGHLEQWPVLAVLVDRTELLLYGESVYSSEDSLGESLAFRLFGDGVREVRFEHGVGPEDLHSFLEALWGRDEDSTEEDDDVVTRLWSKDLATITFVTAEDIVQAPWSEELAPQEHGFFAAPPASFTVVLDRERKLAVNASTASGVGPPAAGENLRRDGSGLVGFEVTGWERAALEREIETERSLQADGYVLSMLKAILVSERSPAVLNRALEVVPAALDTLLTQGNWPALVDVLAMLESAPDTNASFGMTERVLAQRVLDSINLPERVALFETGLKTAPEVLAGLSGVFARLSSASVGALCGVLANLTNDEHRAALRDTLIRLGVENPEPVLKGLADPRPQYVLDLVAIIVAWQQPQAAGVLSMLAHHPAPAVRVEALASIARLHPKGEGAPVMAFVSDAEREVRLHALRLLASGRYAAPWEAWRPHLQDPEALLEQPRADKRGLFQALRVTAGDGAIPFWTELIGGRRWKQRQKREETALLAVKELATLDTQAAWDALEGSRRESGGAVRKAIVAALAARKER